MSRDGVATAVGIRNDQIRTSASVEQKLVDVSCLICGGGNQDTVASTAEIAAQHRILQDFHHRRRRDAEADLKDRTTFSQDYATEVVRCRACGFLFRNPRPSLGAVTERYAEDEYGEAHLKDELQAQKSWAEHKLAACARHCGFSAERPVVVEVGSFVGGFLAAVQRRGWSILGIDPGNEVVKFCQARGLPVFHGTLNEAAIRAHSVDAVVIWNTFDQLVNPDSTLAATRRILRGDGHLVLRVPNGEMFYQGVQWLTAGGCRRSWAILALAWNNLLSFPYLNGYSPVTLDHLVARHGFTRVAIETDTLMTLSDEQTTRWGVWEERVVKYACRALAGSNNASSSFQTMMSPWLDAYYAVSPDARASSSPLLAKIR